MNCPTCNHGNVWVDNWGNVVDAHPPQQFGSNLSLNITPGYTMNPMWTRTWHSPASPSAIHSTYVPPPHYPHSRPASPAQSIRSRKSYLSKASRRKCVEDSDEEFDDKRSTRSGGPKREAARHRRISKQSSSITRELTSSEEEMEFQSDSVRESEDIVENSSQGDEEEEEETSQKRPATPLGRWECEHCTFVNEPLKKVCSICCKTPSTSKIKLIPDTKFQKKHDPSFDRRSVRSSALQKRRSSDDFKDWSETESVLNKFQKQLSLLENATKNKESRKGRVVERSRCGTTPKTPQPPPPKIK